MAIIRVSIHPAMGFSRVGDSQAPPYFGPESEVKAPRYLTTVKDSGCAVIKQAARFRVFAWESPTQAREISGAANLSWRVHLANRKAALPRRNTTVTDRSALVIDAGSRLIDLYKPHATFDTGSITFPGAKPVSVDLGAAWMDEVGRLVVVGGNGQAQSPLGAPITNYLDNDQWFDDVSDGPVNATVLIDGKVYEADPAWLVVAPPRFAPTIQSPITLWDRLFDLFAHDTSRDWGVKLPARPSFRRDILPILERGWRLRWVNKRARGHYSFSDPAKLNTQAFDAVRARILATIRGIGPAGRMPLVQPATGGDQLTRWQLAALRAWQHLGHFDSDADQPADGSVTPWGLDRAALDDCVGGPFYPGIEVTASILELSKYRAAFRLDPAKVRPGDVTAAMALPWQADFFSCAEQTAVRDNVRQDEVVPWWPAARPNQVSQSLTEPPVEWMRNVPNQLALTTSWPSLGFMLPSDEGIIEARGCPPVRIVIDRIRIPPMRLRGPIPKRLRVPIGLEIETHHPIELIGVAPRDRRLTWENDRPFRIDSTGGQPVRLELGMLAVARSSRVRIDQMVVLREVGGPRQWTFRVCEDVVAEPPRELRTRSRMASRSDLRVVRDELLALDQPEQIDVPVCEYDRALVIALEGTPLELDLTSPHGRIDLEAPTACHGEVGVVRVELPAPVGGGRVAGPGGWVLRLCPRRAGHLRVTVAVESTLRFEDGEVSCATGQGEPVATNVLIDRVDRGLGEVVRARGTTTAGYRFERVLEPAGERQ